MCVLYYRYIATYFLCPFSTDVEPYAVSVVNTACEKPLHTLPVKSISSIATRRNFTVCVAPLHFNDSNANNEFVEWIELNRILGADFFVFYNYSTTPLENSVLSYYSKRGLAEVLPWNLLLTEQTMHYYAQMAAINDCIFRHRMNTNFIAIFDLDEFIIPRNSEDLTWYDMLARLPKASSYVFRNVFFPTQWGHRRNNKLNAPTVFDTVQRESFIWPLRKRTKSILNPKVIDISGIHFVWEHTEGYTVNVTEDTGLLHHYRDWNSTTGNLNIVADTTMWKYRKLLMEQVDKTRKHIRQSKQ